MVFSKTNLEFRIIGVFKIKQNNVHSMGKNRNFSCISFRTNSDAKITTENQKIEMKNGTVSFFPSNVDYKRSANSDEMIAVDIEMLNYDSKVIEYYCTEKFDKMDKLFNSLYKSWTSPDKNRRYKCFSILYSILALCNQECRSEENGYPDYFSKSLEYIHKNYCNSDLSIAEISKSVSTNETYLRKAFRDYLGISPKNYINKLRIKKAASMLKSGYYSVCETAFSCGFTDEKYFSTVFKKYINQPPSAYLHNDITK